MYDPMTVAFEIRYPWRTRRHRKSKSKFLRTYHDSFITIWHVDPERDGTDDSCNWFGHNLTKAEAAYMRGILENPDDNIRGYFGDMNEYEQEHIVMCVARFAKRLYKPRHWWQHPRWHIWHWRLQCHPLQSFKRWAWSRCAKCGGRFAWGASVFSGSWSGTGPRWFKGEQGVYHRQCYGVAIDPVDAA